MIREYNNGIRTGFGEPQGEKPVGVLSLLLEKSNHTSQKRAMEISASKGNSIGLANKRGTSRPAF